MGEEMGRSDYQGKRGGNAGDDYHELWAARRALELITPGTDLVALALEGVSADDAEGVPDALWDGVDATFYFGSGVDDIARVELVQFKYSGSDPGSSWTISRLCYASNAGRTNALIYRLASAWKGMRDKRPELVKSGGVVVKLASNQRVPQEVLLALAAPASDADREKLRVASKLTKKDFAVFIQALDFSGCGDLSRFAHEERVIAALSELRDGDVRNDFAVLREFVRKRMRPEGRGDITRESVFGIFGHADPRTFYPCPSVTQQTTNLVPRAASDRISQLFHEGRRKVYLVGAGGEGKTTILQDLSRVLPADSELVVYDCYGGGTYLNSDGYRHRAEDALLQLSNDVAARLLLPPTFSERDKDQFRSFSHRLAAAAEALASKNPEALLVLAVDAADNAVTAASSCVPPERPFVVELARLGALPDNVRLMFSARPGRLDELELPSDFARVDLGPFTPEESRALVEGRLGPMPEEWHSEFQSFSGGNPRVQSYAIDFAEGSSSAALAYLKPNGKDLDRIFHARLEEALLKAGGSGDLARLSGALVLLPRPVPLAVLADIVEFKPDHVRDLVLDLRPGLVVSEDVVSFADEDFEQFLRDFGGAALPSLRERAADVLWRDRGSHPYACNHAAAMLLAAGRRQSIIELVKEPTSTYPLESASAKNEVHRRRLRAAMHVCSETGDVVEAAAILLEGAQALKTDEALKRTMRDHIELSANFSRDEIFSLVIRDRKRRPDHGELLLHLAGIDGVAGDRIGARVQFRNFIAWLESRSAALEAAKSSMEDPDRHGRPVDEDGIARSWRFEADATAAMMLGLLHGEDPSEYLRVLRRPRPAEFRYAVLRLLVERLARRNEVEKLLGIRKALSPLHPLQGLVELALALSGGPAESATMLSHLEKLNGPDGVRLNDPTSDYIQHKTVFEDVRSVQDACDIVALNGGDRERLSKILAAMSQEPTRAARAMVDYFAKATDAAARAFALDCALNGQPITFEGFLVRPTVPPAEEADKDDAETMRSRNEVISDERKAREFYEPILALHAVRSKVIVGSIPADEAAAAIQKALNSLRQARRYTGRDHEWRHRDHAAIGSLFILGLVPGIDCDVLFREIAKALDFSGRLMGPGVRGAFEQASVIPGFRAVIVELAIKACDACREIKMSAEDKIETMVSIAKLLLPLDRSAAKYSYDAALGIAGDVDYDTLYGIALAAPLAERARDAASEDESRSLAVDLVAIFQDAGYRLGESERFPWEEGARSFAALAPQIALAAVSRFSELDLVSGRSMFAHVVERMATYGSVNSDVLCAFLPLLGDRNERLAELLLRRAADADDNALAERVARYLLLEPSGSPEKQVADASRISRPGPATEDFIATSQFASGLVFSDVAAYDGYPFDPLGSEREELDPKLYEIREVDDVSGLLRRIDEIAAAEKSNYPSRNGILNKLLDRAPLHRTADYLDLLVALPESEMAVLDLAQILSHRLNKWSDRPAANRWVKERLLRTIEHRLPSLAWNLAYRGPHLSVLIARCEEAPAELVLRLLRAVETHIDKLNSPTIFQFVGLIAPYLTPEQALELLTKHAGSLRDGLAPQDRVVPGFETVGDLPSSVARFLYSELGHIAQANRWRAAHGIRLLARSGDSTVLPLLVDGYDHTSEPAFGHPDAPVYVWSSRLWLMVSLARIAWETPSSLARVRHWLLRQGEREDLPHLLVRGFAQQALRGLAAADPALFDDEELRRIEAINGSPLPEVQDVDSSRQKGFDRYNSPDDDNRRFRFDTIQTLPDMYTPFLRCFADPDGEVFLERTARWIVDVFGVKDDPWKYDEIRGRSRFDRDGAWTGSGGLQSIERYRAYVEYHAMFLAGGEVLRLWPLSASEDGDDWNYFPAWLERQGLTQPPVWLADLRGAKPLEDLAWVRPATVDWLDPPSAADFRQALGLDRDEWMIVSSSRSYTYGDTYGRVEVESALVSPKTAVALQRALEAYGRRYAYRLPVGADAGEDYDMPDFFLKPLLRDNEGDARLDTNDPLRGTVTGKGPMLLDSIVDLLKLVPGASGDGALRDARDQIVVHRRSWSDAKPPNRRMSEDAVEGSDLWIRRSAVRRIIEETGLDLIIELTFNRRIGEPSYDRKKDESRERETDRILIFRSDGRIDGGPDDLGHWS